MRILLKGTIISMEFKFKESTIRRPVVRLSSASFIGAKHGYELLVYWTSGVFMNVRTYTRKWTGIVNEVTYQMFQGIDISIDV